jgi:hypothetical protein
VSRFGLKRGQRVGLIRTSNPRIIGTKTFPRPIHAHAPIFRKQAQIQNRALSLEDVLSNWASAVIPPSPRIRAWFVLLRTVKLITVAAALQTRSSGVSALDISTKYLIKSSKMPRSATSAETASSVGPKKTPNSQSGGLTESRARLGCMKPSDLGLNLRKWRRTVRVGKFWGCQRRGAVTDWNT